jgi:hypothetical protein
VILGDCNVAFFLIFRFLVYEIVNIYPQVYGKDESPDSNARDEALYGTL